MPFGKTYEEILELIRVKLLDTQMCRDIVRRAGARPAVSGEDGSGNLFVGGEPWEAIVKLSADDYDVGWRKDGLGPPWGNYNSGPPCNLRAFQFLRLRDSLLRSGTSNSGRFGYALDRHVSKNEAIGGGGIATYYERKNFAGTSDYSLMYQGAELTGADQDIIDTILYFAKDQARVTAYVTKADFPWRISVTLSRGASNQTGPDLTYTIDGSSTGRVEGDWVDFPPMDTSSTPTYLLGALSTHGFVADISIDAQSDSSIGTIPTTYNELREGTGPIAMPFLEVEVRTVYFPERSYWVQDEYTPDEYRVAEWEIEAG